MKGEIPDEDGGTEFFDVTFAVARRCFCQSFYSCITDCSTPENSTEFINELQNVCKRKETETVSDDEGKRKYNTEVRYSLKREMTSSRGLTSVQRASRDLDDLKGR